MINPHSPRYGEVEKLRANCHAVLQDPSVASSPIEKRVAFLQSKNLTQEEVDLALSRVGEDPVAAAAASGTVSAPSQYTSQQVAYRPPSQSPQGYGYPPYNQWQPPPEYVLTRLPLESETDRMTGRRRETGGTGL
jgi:peroxin-14